MSKQKKPKAKTETTTTPTVDSAARTGRGGRAEGGRGRGRATERGGRGGSRGKPSFPATNGTSTRAPKETPLSVPTEESSAWDNTPKPAADDTTAGWGESTETPAVPADPTPVSVLSSIAPPPAAAPASAGPKTWASMLRQSTVPKVAPKPKEAPAPAPAPVEQPNIEPLPPVEQAPAEPEPVVPAVEEQPAAPIEEETPKAPESAPAPVPVPVAVPELALAPSKDELTEENLERVEDGSHPPVTETAASEAADSWNPRAGDVSAVATPLSGPHAKDATKAPISGYAATAIKATERNPIRTPSYQRRVLEQEEAVRMPGHRDQVNQAAVQFGAFSLNGEDDIDGDREEPETRAQPPVDSPVSQPRASLPPVQAPTAVPEPFAAQKPAPINPPTGPSGTTLPPPLLSRELYTDSMHSAAVAPPQSLPSAAPQSASPFPTVPHHEDKSIISSKLMPIFSSTAQPIGQTPQQYGRFGQSLPQEPSGFPSQQKPFDAFGQQPQSAVPASTQSHYDNSFGSQAPPSQPAQQQPSFSSAPGDYSQYYTSDAQSRSQYGNYYNGQQYGQQGASQGPPEGPSSQQRGYGAGNYNSAPLNENLSQYPQSTAATQARYGAAAAVDNSGNNTPNPPAAQAPQSAAAQSQSQGQQPHDYNYSQHPYYTSPYYAAYMNQQHYGGYNQGGYGGPYGKGGYGQPQGYGMNPQGPYGAHGSSPANSYSQSTLHRADSGGASGAAGLGDYGRAGAAQTGSSQPALGGSGFGGHDSFSRGGPYGSQGQSYGSAGAQAPVDDLKPFGDAKPGSGPSPSMSAAARPGSAANNGPSQSGLPPAQSGQQGLGYGGYPSHLQQGGLHGAQSGASGYGMGASSGQGHNNNPYGGYGNQGFGGSYGGYNNQPRGGWGGNYH